MSLLEIQTLCCGILVGLIWTIQLLHYPAFAYVREDQFLQFHRQHSMRITFIVAPLMGLELISAVGLLWLFSQSYWAWLNLAGVVVIWACTFFISVPIHESLAQQMNQSQIQRLVATNWLRTALWSARLVLLVLWGMGS